MTHSPLLKPKTDLTELHGAEQRKEFVALDLPDSQVVQAIAREGRGMICYLHQPRQHGIDGTLWTKTGVAYLPTACFTEGQKSS